MRAVVLLSGGVDSSACVAFYLGLEFEVEALFLHYGQPPADSEWRSARQIAQHYRIPIDKIVCTTSPTQFSGEITGRNAFLLFSALVYNPGLSGLIALGIHAGTPYFDCSRRFSEEASRLLQDCSGGKVDLGVPFLSWSKDRIWRFCLHRQVPVQLTWSCEVGPDAPCGQCLSCQDREALHVREEE
jgi:7-cyano-7-deazaguanine synthase